MPIFFDEEVTETLLRQLYYVRLHSISPPSFLEEKGDVLTHDGKNILNMGIQHPFKIKDTVLGGTGCRM